MNVARLALLGCALAACSNTTPPTGVDASSGPSDAGPGDIDAGADATTSDTDSGPPPAACFGAFAAGECTTCLETSCCDEVAACLETEGCHGCVTGRAACAGTPAEAAFHACGVASCDDVCFLDRSPCNPVTNAGCPAGRACGPDGAGGFVCGGPLGDADVCEACGDGGAACGPGLYCAGTLCLRFCCTNADCDGEVCSRSSPTDAVGFCFQSDAAPGCRGPAVPPSGGTCWTMP